MSKVRYEIRAKTGTYKDRDGNEKTAYSKIGVVFEGDKGFSMKLELIPLGWDGFAFLSDPKPKEALRNTPTKPSSADAFADMSDDIPF